MTEQIGRVGDARYDSDRDRVLALSGVDINAPKPESPEVVKNIKDAEEAERRARGRAATILTGGAGLATDASSARRTLLGAV